MSNVYTLPVKNKRAAPLRHTPTFLMDFLHANKFKDEHSWSKAYYCEVYSVADDCRGLRLGKLLHALLSLNDYAYEGRRYVYCKDWHKNYRHGNSKAWVQVYYMDHQKRLHVTFFAPPPKIVIVGRQLKPKEPSIKDRFPNLWNFFHGALQTNSGGAASDDCFAEFSDSLLARAEEELKEVCELAAVTNLAAVLGSLADMGYTLHGQTTQAQPNGDDEQHPLLAFELLDTCY